MSTLDTSGGATPPAADTPPEVTPPAPTPAPVPAGGVNSDGIPTLHGVPVFVLDNPFGGVGIGILIGLDLAASHEAGQPMVAPATSDADSHPLPRSGGAAHYTDLMTGKGWSVPLNPEGN